MKKNAEQNGAINETMSPDSVTKTNSIDSTEPAILMPFDPYQNTIFDDICKL